VVSGSAGGSRGWDEAGLFEQQPVVHQVDRDVLAVVEAERSELAIRSSRRFR
jgi:hypothetical protein